MRKIISIAAAVICGVIIIADYFLQSTWLQVAAARLLEGGIVLACFALVLGILKLVAYHAQRLRGNIQNKWQSWIILVGLLGMLLLGIFADGPTEQWVYSFIITPLITTMGALLIFYAVLAAPRLLTLRHGAAVILLISCVIFLLLWAPGISAVSPLIAAVRNWLYASLLGSSMRGLLLGSAIGAIVAALRILFFIDHPYTGIGEKH